MNTQQIEFPTFANQVRFTNKIAAQLVALTKKYISRPVLNELEIMERDARAGIVFLLNYRQIETIFIAQHAAHEADRKRPVRHLIMEGQYFASHQTCEVKQIAEKAIFHLS